MENKEIQVVSFMKENGNFIDYQNINIEEIEKRLENASLTPMERRRLEAIYKNCQLLQKDSFTEKTSFLSEETKTSLRKRRIEDMKKEKTLHARKLIVRAGIIFALGAAGFVGFKVYHDNHIKPIQILNEEYDKIYSTITVKSGQTLTHIAKEIYNTYPEEVKKLRTEEDVIDEIVHMNHLPNKDEIRSGQTLFIPKQYIEEQDEISNGKTY